MSKVYNDIDVTNRYLNRYLLYNILFYNKSQIKAL